MATNKEFKRTIAGSVGAGIGAIINGSGRTYYILEHKTQTAYHKIGESQKIIIDEIELGRSSDCQVKFDESCATVSRKHAAIVREGQGWKVIALSQTNGTYVNNVPVQGERLLNSGDEIRLSSTGPIIGFIVPQGAQSLVKSIGMTERMNLFRQQALRPYKTAITVLSVAIVVAFGGTFGYTFWKDTQHENVIQEQSATLAAQGQSISEQEQKQKQLAEEMKNQKSELEAGFAEEMKKQQGIVDSLNMQYAMEDSILKAKQAALEAASNEERAKLQAEIKKAQNSAYAANKRAAEAQKALTTANGVIDSLSTQYVTLIQAVAASDSLYQVKQNQLMQATAEDKAKIEAEMKKSQIAAEADRKRMALIEKQMASLKEALADKDKTIAEQNAEIENIKKDYAVRMDSLKKVSNKAMEDYTAIVKAKENEKVQPVVNQTAPVKVDTVKPKKIEVAP